MVSKAVLNRVSMKGNISIQLNEEQLDAVEFKGKHLLVLAGAGTGKTQTIISRENI